MQIFTTQLSEYCRVAAKETPGILEPFAARQRQNRGVSPKNIGPPSARDRTRTPRHAVIYTSQYHSFSKTGTTKFPTSNDV
jgi:hypothetical protein